MEIAYHIPVMLKECIEGLAIKPDGVYVDITFGGGGHSRAILEQLGENGKLYAFDQDEEAANNAAKIDDPRLIFIQSNFCYLKKYLKMYKQDLVDGVLGDLGVSSHQFDADYRGFSYRFDAALDMRMSRGAEQTAADIINEYRAEDLHRIFGMYGEVKNARTVAQAISSARVNKKIETTSDLQEVLKKYAPRGKENKYYAQVFQALRIEVNKELDVLKEALEQIAQVLKPEGRAVIMSYHSLEDRLVKNYLAKGVFSGEPEKDFYGNVDRPFDLVTRKAVEARQEEVDLNPRARSAKLRIAKKSISHGEHK